MTRAVKLHSDERTEWGEVMAVYRGQLMFYLDYLLDCNCGEAILGRVEVEVGERCVADDFKHRFLLRTLVRTVIEHLTECTHQWESTQVRALKSRNLVANIPGLERLVYFARDILEYSTRDTSLLIGITDARVEELLLSARKRIDMAEGPSSLKIQTREWTYFRWKLTDLHTR